MGASKNYEIDFITRTREILTKYYPDFQDKGREVTFLLNCLLGLIITTVAESKKKGKGAIFKVEIDESFLLLIPDKIGFINSNKLVIDSMDFIDRNEMEVRVPIGHKNDLKKMTKLWFLEKIRNGIAHQNIKSINENESWIGIMLWNENHNKKDFEIIFTIDELKNLAIEISKKYLSAHDT